MRSPGQVLGHRQHQQEVDDGRRDQEAEGGAEHGSPQDPDALDRLARLRIRDAGAFEAGAVAVQILGAERTDERIDDALDERVHDVGERGADDDGDRQVDHIAAQQEGLEALHQADLFLLLAHE